MHILNIYLLYTDTYTVQMCAYVCVGCMCVFDECVYSRNVYVVYTGIHAVGTHTHAHACRVHSSMPGILLYHCLPQSHSHCLSLDLELILAVASSSDWSVSSLHRAGFAGKLSGSAAHTYTENVFTL